MSEEEYKRAHTLQEELSREIKSLLSQKLSGEMPAVEEMVREHMQEQFRFWRD